MRWDYGTIYKNIRKGKGLNQSDICGDHLSRTTLSKFENNKLTPSYETMTFLLSQVDISDEEFNYICNNYDYDEKNRIISLFFSSTSNLETETLCELEEVMTSYLRTNNDRLITDIQKLVKSLQLLSIDKAAKIDCLPKIIVSDIWSRIEKMDNWYYSEIRIINCLMFYFPLETVAAFLPKLLKNIEKYDQFMPLLTVKISILLNASLLFIQNSEGTTALPLLEQAVSDAKKAKRYDYLAIANTRYAICTNNEELFQSTIVILSSFDEIELINHLQKEWEIFSTHYS